MTQTIAQQIKWDFETNGEFIIRDKNGRIIYFEKPDGYWAKWEYDSQDRPLYYEDSDGDIVDYRPKPLEIPTSISVGVYYYIDEETGKPVFDTESMTNEFETKLNNL